MSVRRVSWVGLIVLFLAGRSAWAQEPAAAPPPKTEPAPPPVLTLGPFDVSVNWRARAERWDWFEGAAGDSNYTFRDSLLRVAIGQRTDRVDWQLEAEQAA